MSSNVSQPFFVYGKQYEGINYFFKTCCYENSSNNTGRGVGTLSLLVVYITKNNYTNIKK